MNPAISGAGGIHVTRSEISRNKRENCSLVFLNFSIEALGLQKYSKRTREQCRRRRRRRRTKSSSVSTVSRMGPCTRWTRSSFASTTKTTTRQGTPKWKRLDEATARTSIHPHRIECITEIRFQGFLNTHTEGLKPLPRRWMESSTTRIQWVTQDDTVMEICNG